MQESQLRMDKEKLDWEKAKLKRILPLGSSKWKAKMKLKSYSWKRKSA